VAFAEIVAAKVCVPASWAGTRRIACDQESWMMWSCGAKKVTAKYRQEGLARTAYWLFRKSLSRLVTIYRSDLLTRPLEGALPAPKAKIPLEIRRAGREDEILFREILSPWKSWSSIIRRRFKEDKICFLAWHEGRPVGYIWISLTEEFEPNSGIMVKSGTDGSYGFDLQVLPWYRKYLVGHELLGHWLHFSRQVGRSRAFGLVAAENQPMRLTLKLFFGFKRDKTYTSLRFLGRRGFVLPRLNQDQ
jgi:GNAT superfamily N-acetyltransferase